MTSIWEVLLNLAKMDQLETPFSLGYILKNCGVVSQKRGWKFVESIFEELIKPTTGLADAPVETRIRDVPINHIIMTSVQLIL
jgi:hypothetical protein